MPAKSQAQQKAAGAALSAKRGETKKSELKGASKSMEKSMSEKELKEPRGNRPQKPAEEKEVIFDALQKSTELCLSNRALLPFAVAELNACNDGGSQPD